jgi:hypothetical protein
MFIRNQKQFRNLVQKIFHNIQIESVKTPNPNFLKFIPVGKNILGDKGTLDISSRQYSSISPLAEELFEVPGVTRIFFGADYLSVAK